MVRKRPRLLSSAFPCHWASHLISLSLNFPGVCRDNSFSFASCNDFRIMTLKAPQFILYKRFGCVKHIAENSSRGPDVNHTKASLMGGDGSASRVSLPSLIWLTQKFLLYSSHRWKKIKVYVCQMFPNVRYMVILNVLSTGAEMENSNVRYLTLELQLPFIVRAK